MMNHNSDPSHRSSATAALVGLTAVTALMVPNVSQLTPRLAPSIAVQIDKEPLAGHNLHSNVAVQPETVPEESTSVAIHPASIILGYKAEHPHKTFTITKNLEKEPLAHHPEKTIAAKLPIMIIPTPKPRPVTLPKPIETAPTGGVVAPTPGPGEDQPAPSQLFNLHPENLNVPESIKAIMDRSVVHINELGCSGFLIFNKTGMPIGVRTAQHCGILPTGGHWSTTEPNKSVTFNFTRPLIVSRGLDFATEKPIDTITQLIVPTADNNKNDNALGVFANSTPEEVLANSMQMSHDEISTLKKGDVIYNSGFPVNQKFNNDSTKRQDFAMSVLGQAEWTIANGKILKLLVAAVPLTKDGAECSWGNSGSQAFIVRADGTIGLIGAESGFNDFGFLYNDAVNGAVEKAAIESYFGVDMTGYAAVCGFAYEVPSQESGMVVGPVNVTDTLPVTETIADKVRQFAVKTFEDNTHDRTIIDGIVQVPSSKGDYMIEHPEIIYDDVDKSYALISYSSELKGHVSITVLPKLDNLIVYSENGQPISIHDQVSDYRDTGTSFALDNGYAVGNTNLLKGTTFDGPYRIIGNPTNPKKYTFVLTGK